MPQSSPKLILLLLLSANGATALAMSCNDINHEQSDAPAGSSANNPESFSLIPMNRDLTQGPDSLEFIDLTFIRNGDRQLAPAMKIDSSHFSGYEKKSTPQGDVTEAYFTPTTQQIGTVFGSGTSVGFPITAIPPNQYSLVDQRRMVREYIIKNHSNGPTMAESTIEMTANAILKNPEALKNAIAFHQGSADRTNSSSTQNRIHLTSSGPDRYFWFIPDGKRNLMAARVLHIWENRNWQTDQEDAYTVLAEYTDVGSDITYRVRHVGELTLSELNTIIIGNSAASRDAFLDSLTPIELQTIQYATELKLRLSNYATLTGSGASTSSLDMMNNITWMAVYGSLRDSGMPIKELLDDSSSALGTPTEGNVIDAFARLSPRSVMARFQSRKFEYMFVITEDGQLKICPKMKTGNNLRAQLLRLAASRQIYVGGNFTINADGSLNIQIDPNGYEIRDRSYSNLLDTMGSSSGNVEKFARLVFRVQAGMQINKTSSSLADMIAQMGDDAFKRQYDQARAQESAENDEFESKLNQMGQTDDRAAEVKAVTWDLEKGRPLPYEEWLKALKIGKLNARARYTKILWGHYVLRTTQDSKISEIKTSYYKLSKRFHPNDPQNIGTEESMKVLVEAWEVFDPKHQNRGKSDE